MALCGILCKTFFTFFGGGEGGDLEVGKLSTESVF